MMRKAPPTAKTVHGVAWHAVHAHTVHGVLLIGLLIALAIGSIALMAGVDLWSSYRTRERETQLLFVGDQYRRAIRSYYFAAPSGTPRVLPQSFAELLHDDRYALPLRHLRRIYPDPVTGNPDWGELRVDGRLSAVFSLSEQKPMKQAGFAPLYENFAEQDHYKGWVFGFVSPPRSASVATAPSTPVPERTP
jgi:type II secretory pathway pseudopilin PulG